MRRGDVRWCPFAPPDKLRPVVVLTRGGALGFLSHATVAPLTTRIRNSPVVVRLSPEVDRVLEECVVTLDSLQTVPQSRLGDLITRLSDQRLEEIRKALLFALGW